MWTLLLTNIRNRYKFTFYNHELQNMILFKNEITVKMVIELEKISFGMLLQLKLQF